MRKPRQASLEKKDIYWQVLNAAIALDIKKGSLRWSMTELAKHSKISRTLIYYYFGKSKENILLEAINLFGKELSGSTPKRMEAWKAGDITSTLHSTQELLALSPSIRFFYFLKREENSKIGTLIRDYEIKFRKKIALFFPSLSKPELEGLFAMLLGIALTPNLSKEAVQGAIGLVASKVKKP